MTSMRAAFRSIGLLAACGLASPALSAGGPACSVDTLSQTVDTNIALGAGFACQDLGTGAIFQTSYARSYDLSMGATAGLNVSITCVTFGIELNTIGDYLVDINIYQDLDGGLPDSSMGDLMLIASTMVSIPIVNDPFMDQSSFTADFTGAPVALPVDSVMVVELVLPTRFGVDNGETLPGFSQGGESQESFIKTVDCAVPTYVPLSTLGFFVNHLIQVVSWEEMIIVETCPEDCANADDQVDVSDLLGVLAGWGQPGQACDIAGGDDTIDVSDLLALLAAWGPCPMPPPLCPGDTDDSGMVDVSDLLTLLADWGPVVGSSPADFDLSGNVDVNDLLTLLAAWGPCPM